MSSIFKIREGFATYTETEKRLAEYILEHRQDVVNQSAQVLGEKVHTSAAAVVRFSKKLGFKGFTALKVEIARDSSGDAIDFDEIIKEEDSIGVMVKKANAINLKTIEKTYSLINVEHLESAINALIGARNICLFGVGGSGIVCDDFYNKLIRIDKRASFNKDTHLQIASVANITKDDVAIGISYGGNTKETNTAMAYAANIGAMTIGITQYSKSKLSKICDILLYIPSEEKELRLGAIQSRNSSLIMTDLLYYGITKAEIEETKEKLRKTREITSELR